MWNSPDEREEEEGYTLDDFIGAEGVETQG